MSSLTTDVCGPSLNQYRSFFLEELLFKLWMGAVILHIKQKGTSPASIQFKQSGGTETLYLAK